MPETAEQAVAICRAGGVAQTKAITVRSVAGEKYDRIVAYVLGEKHQYRKPGWDNDAGDGDEPTADWATDEECPF